MQLLGPTGGGATPVIQPRQLLVQNPCFGYAQPHTMMGPQAQPFPPSGQQMRPQVQTVNPSNQSQKVAGSDFSKVVGCVKESDCGCGWMFCPLCQGGDVPKLDVSCVPLGCWCGVSQCLRGNKLRTEAYPFDWNRVSLEGVIHFLENRFEGFLQYERTQEFPWDKQHGGLTYCGKYHSFWHDDLTKQEAHDKYTRRIDRLFDLPNRKLLFVRAVNESSEVPKVERLLETLQRVFSDHDVWLLVIIDHQSTFASYVVKGSNNRLLISVTDKRHIGTPLYYDDVKAYDQAILTAFSSVVGRAVAPNILQPGSLPAITNLQAFAAQLDPFFSGSVQDSTWHAKAVPAHGLMPNGMGGWQQQPQQSLPAPQPQNPSSPRGPRQSRSQSSSVRQAQRAQNGPPQSSTLTPRASSVSPAIKSAQEACTSTVKVQVESLASSSPRAPRTEVQVECLPPSSPPLSPDPSVSVVRNRDNQERHANRVPVRVEVQPYTQTTGELPSAYGAYLLTPEKLRLEASKGSTCQPENGTKVPTPGGCSENGVHSLLKYANEVANEVADTIHPQPKAGLQPQVQPKQQPALLSKTNGETQTFLAHEIPIPFCPKLPPLGDEVRKRILPGPAGIRKEDAKEAVCTQPGIEADEVLVAGLSAQERKLQDLRTELEKPRLDAARLWKQLDNAAKRGDELQLRLEQASQQFKAARLAIQSMDMSRSISCVANDN